MATPKIDQELDQDRVTDLVETFDKYGYVMFPQQRAIYQKIAERTRYKSILEAGCGNGVGTAVLERCASGIVGTDKLTRNVQFAKCLYPWIDFQTWDLNYPTNLGAKVVVCIETLEHVVDAGAALKHLIDAAREEVWISTPNASVRKQPPENPYHVAEFTPRQILCMVNEVAPGCSMDIVDWESFKHLSTNTQVDPLVYRICKP